MKKLHTYLFFISILITAVTFGQAPRGGGKERKETKAVKESKKEEKAAISARDTLPPAEKYGLRVGVDIAKFIRSAVNDDYKGFEINGDYRVYRNYYLAAELGNESLIRDEININAEGSGSYVRLGADYNAYKNWYGMQNSIYVGLRFGFSTFSQELTDYNIFTGTDFFGENEEGQGENFRNEAREVDGLTAGWVEFTLGLKVELFSNIYLSAAVSLRSVVNEESPDGFENLFIPGFGRTNDFSRFGVGYNYTISYLIPFIKRKR